MMIKSNKVWWRGILLFVGLGVILIGLVATGYGVEADEQGQQLLSVPDLPDTPYEYADIELPLHLYVLYNNIPDDNPITNDGATLGRVLFYDQRLSVNNEVACASCHLQSSAFSDPVALSTGFDGEHTRRNSMGLSNNRYFQPDQFFWDQRAASLEELVLLPIQDPIEMGSDLDQVVSELQATSFYPDLFAAAFGTPEIRSERMSLALAQFVRSIVSYESKYDVGLPIGFTNYTEQEAAGLSLFEAHNLRCSVCHTTDTQILLGARNNGLDTIYEDNGMGEITENQYDMGRFKPPSLRNIALTGPYMHDGRFETLEEVLTHYQNGIQPHANLDEFLPVGGIQFSDADKQALLAYLHTLTDEALLVDPKYSDPFPPVWQMYLPVIE